MLPLPVRVLAEFLGTALLLAAVVGSGIHAERLAPAAPALALLANTFASVTTLFALVLALRPLSGAHFNPAVTLAACLRREAAPAAGLAYAAAQVAGGLAGIVLAHAMFELPLLQTGVHVRSGTGLFVSEIVATALLLLVILRTAAQPGLALPAAVAATIAGAYWFTASTSFANPAVTLARAFTSTYAGIRPADVPAFVVAQVLGTLLALGVERAWRTSGLRP